ncbi:MAG: hypothetical protein D6679_06020 [Candidatus Hydrogenedentota bacterium]|nr:MAG: hypothetical protein D6679_06020 [Candidatus Hydrogenedentota bacterium]
MKHETTRPPLDPIILGHNPFFGVDHLSHEKGAARDQKFSDIRNVTAMIRFARERGVDALMLSTHPRARPICDALRAEPGISDGLRLYPVLPYIAKYVRMANEKGLTNVVLDSLSGAGIGTKLGTILKGGAGVLGRDLMKMIETLIDLEMAVFTSLDLRAVFLHQALTDLCLGLGLRGIFEFYEEYIPRRYNGAAAAYCTYNLPYLLRRLHEWGIERPVIMASFNKAGYQMNPDRPSNERALKEGGLSFVAMGTLASGYLRPAEAYEYLFRFPNVDSIVVGVSTEAHAEETFAVIRREREARGA